MAMINDHDGRRNEMNDPILFINACVRKDSRTKRLANKLLQKLNKPYTELCLGDIQFPTVDEEFLNMRDRLVSAQQYDAPMFQFARQFAQAETIVISILKSGTRNRKARSNDRFFKRTPA